MPLFSVLIPAYNAERFIIDALDSVARQTFTDYEIIVVDDGSQDATSKQVEAWAKWNSDKSLRLYWQHNKGIGAARNRAMWESVGKYIAFLDADDSWTEQKLERVGHYLEEFPAVDLVCHNEGVVGLGECQRVLRYGPHTEYEALLFKGNCISTSATVVRRGKVLQVGGFSDDLRFNGVEDYDLWLRLARAGCRFAYLDEAMGVYRVHDQGITSKVEQHCEHCLNVLESHFRVFPRQNAYYRYLMRRRRAATMRSAGRNLMEQGNRMQAQRFLIMALKEDPLSWKTWLLGTLNIAHASI
jgi:glycosyltransferase involved in cell wall biosynthesis